MNRVTTNLPRPQQQRRVFSTGRIEPPWDWPTFAQIKPFDHSNATIGGAIGDYLAELGWDNRATISRAERKRRTQMTREAAPNHDIHVRLRVESNWFRFPAMKFAGIKKRFGGPCRLHSLVRSGRLRKLRAIGSASVGIAPSRSQRHWCDQRHTVRSTYNKRPKTGTMTR